MGLRLVLLLEFCILSKRMKNLKRCDFFSPLNYAQDFNVILRCEICGSILAFPYFLIENVDREGIPYNFWINICPPLESGLCFIHSK